MESRWYLFPGQTVENTKICDRSHALHITKKAWGNITKHLDRKKLIQEAIDKEARERKYLDEGSKSMIKNWENSLENIRKRKEEERLRLIEEKKDNRIQRYYALREEQERIRKEYVEKVRKKIYMNTGNARELTGAFIASETLYEREKQKELSGVIKKHEKEEEEKFVKIVRRNAENEVNEKREKEKQLQEKNRQYRELLRKEVEKKELQKQQAKEKQLRNEALDQMRAAEEFECLEKKRKEEMLQKNINLRAEKQKQAKLNKERQHQLDKEEKELDEVIKLYQEAKHKIDCMKKQKEKEAKEANIIKRDAIVKLVMAEQENKAAMEEAQLKATIAEMEAIDEDKMKEKKKFQEKMRQDRIDDRKKFIEREQVRKNKEEELKKWEMLNRYKTDENNKIYEMKRKREHWQKILDYRDDLLGQMEEVKCQQKREKEIEKYMAIKGFVNEDEKFFAYADEILQLAKDKGRPTYPIERVIMQYKKNNMLTDANEGHDCEDYSRKLENSIISRDIIENSSKGKKNKKCRCTVAK